MVTKLGYIAEIIDGVLVGDPDRSIVGVCDLKNGKKDHITFIRAPKYYKYFEATSASAVIVDKKFHLEPSNKSLVIVQDPILAFARVLEIFNNHPQIHPSIHKTAVISPDARVGKNCSIGPNAVIEAKAEIQDGVCIWAGSYIGEETIIGESTTIHPNATIYHNCKIGRNVTIDSGTVIGADGFGWVTNKDGHHKIPQIGRVVVGDNTWVGSNCNIDRGTFTDTIIGNNCKFDSHIHIAHNVTIGEGCLFAAQVGIAGTTTIGKFVTLAGQVGVADHLSIGDNAVIAAKSAVLQSIEAGSFYSGIPARPHKARKRQDVVVQKLPEIAKRLRYLERKIDDRLKEEE